MAEKQASQLPSADNLPQHRGGPSDPPPSYDASMTTGAAGN